MKKRIRTLLKLKLKNRAMFSMLTGMLLLTISAAVVSFLTYTNAMKNHYGDLAVNLAKTVAVIVDTDEVKKLTDQVMETYRSQCGEDGSAPDFEAFTAKDWDAYYDAFKPLYDTPEYESLFECMSKVKENNEVLWVYICFMDETTNKAIYIIDADITESACNIGKCDEIEDENLYMMQHNIYDFPAYSTNYEEYGWLCSSAAAIQDDKGNVIANAYVDISMVDVMDTSISFLRNLLILLIIAAIIICWVYSIIIAHTIVDPINQLAAATSDFVSEKKGNAKDGTTQISQLHIQTGDEIETLATSIQKMEKDINFYIKNLTEVTAEKERIGTELRVAAKIQQETMNCILPELPKQKKIDIEAKLFPSKTPGGSFYDVFMIDEDHLGMIVASATGKGVPAALFMIITKGLIRNQLQEFKSLDAVLYQANNQLWKENDSTIFACVWIGILEISTGRLTYCNAGGENPYLMTANSKNHFLQSQEKPLPIAAWENTKYRAGEVMLHPGDVIFMFTSAVTESCNADKEPYGVERLQETLDVNCHEGMKDLINIQYRELKEYMDQVEQNEDLIMLSLRYGETHISEEN